MAYTHKTALGKAIDGARTDTVEPVIGIIKESAQPSFTPQPNSTALAWLTGNWLLWQESKIRTMRSIRWTSLILMPARASIQ
jgi:hypothetical protein